MVRGGTFKCFGNVEITGALLRNISVLSLGRNVMPVSPQSRQVGRVIL